MRYQASSWRVSENRPLRVGKWMQHHFCSHREKKDLHLLGPTYRISAPGEFFQGLPPDGNSAEVNQSERIAYFPASSHFLSARM